MHLLRIIEGNMYGSSVRCGLVMCIPFFRAFFYIGIVVIPLNCSYSFRWCSACLSRSDFSSSDKLADLIRRGKLDSLFIVAARMDFHNKSVAGFVTLINGSCLSQRSMNFVLLNGTFSSFSHAFLYRRYTSAFVMSVGSKRNLSSLKFGSLPGTGRARLCFLLTVKHLQRSIEMLLCTIFYQNYRVIGFVWLGCLFCSVQPSCDIVYHLLHEQKGRFFDKWACCERKSNQNS